mmetsp:Transcript_86444/g.167498  ORF Transcript_86444/g.167498 Transcript_86444/m.167498 type:complete len:216 (-) Transcript_86444:1249-1896(-)
MSSCIPAPLFTKPSNSFTRSSSRTTSWFCPAVVVLCVGEAGVDGLEGSSPKTLDIPAKSVLFCGDPKAADNARSAPASFSSVSLHLSSEIVRSLWYRSARFSMASKLVLCSSRSVRYRSARLDICVSSALSFSTSFSSCTTFTGCAFSEISSARRCSSAKAAAWISWSLSLIAKLPHSSFRFLIISPASCSKCWDALVSMRLTEAAYRSVLTVSS